MNYKILIALFSFFPLVSVSRQELSDLIKEVGDMMNYFVDNNPCLREDSAEWRAHFKGQINIFHWKYNLCLDREWSFEEVSIASKELMTIMDDIIAYQTAMIYHFCSKSQDS